MVVLYLLLAETEIYVVPEVVVLCVLRPMFFVQVYSFAGIAQYGAG